MKVFSGSKWNKISEPISDTGWRDITSSISSSSLGGATVSCKYRRVEDDVTLIFDVTVAGTSMANTRSFISTSSTNVLRKIGLPVGMVKSWDRVTQTADEYSDSSLKSSWISVSGKGVGVVAEREAEMYWKATQSTSKAGPLGLDRYTLNWVTPDPFPTTIPGTATTL